MVMQIGPLIVSVITTSLGLLAILRGGQFLKSSEAQSRSLGFLLLLSGLLGATLGFYSFWSPELAIPFLVLFFSPFAIHGSIRRLRSSKRVVRLEGLTILVMGLLVIYWLLTRFNWPSPID